MIERKIMTEQATNNNNLQSNNIDDIISSVDETNPQLSEGDSTPEDTDVIRNLIAQKDAQIALLQDELKKSQESWAQAIRQGAAIGNVTPSTNQVGINPQPAQSLSEDYVPLREMDFTMRKEDFYKKK